ncbi:oxidoreductase [Leuconostoc falkenbergense]|uniref:oxidoreductase n=1 Tax=Leuconostoc falkenbergense TaxID=2766470 RepID=UPI002958D812|nr:oxidoreductase [Leuconostoc falkenbergense]MDV8950534.1 SDR family NAD(P)-dependent oxidoreductase [Leuconostoc falkenbergense]
MVAQKVVLITGASSGIGYQTAKKLAAQQFKVYGAARRVDRLAPLVQLGVSPIYMDITDDEAITKAVAHIIEVSGRIDVLINNAGYGSYGAIENVPISEAKKQFDTNLFGLAKLTQLVLPYMRAKQSGRIINVSSMAGRMTTYMGAWYHATKYALEGFSDALRMEVKPFGIDVVLIEPGGIKTNWGIIAADNLKKTSQGTAYQEHALAASERMRQLYSSDKLTNPEVIADTIVKSVINKRTKARYLVGYGAKALVALHTILPTRAFDKIIQKLV